MFNKILVPLDGSELATCVLPHVVAMTQALGSNLTLLRVLEGYDAPGGAVNPIDWQLHKMEAQAYLNALGVRLEQQMAQPPNLQILEGPAAKGIIEYAQTNAFDLVALSSHGHGGLNGWNVSSVVQKVIDRARKSILLVRAYQSSPAYAEPPGAPFHYHRILVPLDGSQRAESVLPMATALAHYHKAELLLVHVVVKPEMLWRIQLAAEDSRLLEQMMERNRAQALQYFALLESQLPVAWQVRVESSSNVATTLHGLVEETAANLVVLSAHGHAGQGQWAYGNVAASFLTYGTTPLLIMQDLLPHEILPSKAERMAVDLPPVVYPPPGNFEGEALKTRATA